MLLEYILLFVLGIVFGSFVTALSYRLANGIQFVKGRSFCPKCKNNIRWYDNIPLFSFLFLLGKCRSCKAKISFRYPLIELTSGVGFVVIAYYQSFVQNLSLWSVNGFLQLLLHLVLFVILLTIFVIDLEYQIIPDSLIYLGLFVSLIYKLLFSPETLLTSIFAGFVSGSILLLVHLITKGKGMGLGDVKFAVLGGMLVGFTLLPVWLMAAFLTGAVAGSILILVGRAKLKTKIAFGPFLVIGIAIALSFGSKVLSLLGL